MVMPIILPIASGLPPSTGASVIANWEIGEWLQKRGVANVHQMNTGGKWNYSDFTVKCVVAQHSSGIADGSYGGNPMGFIIYTDEGNFYYSGDAPYHRHAIDTPVGQN